MANDLLDNILMLWSQSFKEPNLVTIETQKVNMLGGGVYRLPLFAFVIKIVIISDPSIPYVTIYKSKRSASS